VEKCRGKSRRGWKKRLYRAGPVAPARAWAAWRKAPWAKTFRPDRREGAKCRGHGFMHISCPARRPSRPAGPNPPGRSSYHTPDPPAGKDPFEPPSYQFAQCCVLTRIVRKDTSVSAADVFLQEPVRATAYSPGRSRREATASPGNTCPNRQEPTKWAIAAIAEGISSGGGKRPLRGLCPQCPNSPRACRPWLQAGALTGFRRRKGKQKGTAGRPCTLLCGLSVKTGVPSTNRQTLASRIWTAGAELTPRVPLRRQLE
jgi:hypothetical protein